MPDPAEEKSRKTLTMGRYKVTGKLGRGGMGVVYLARDPFIERSVAIKTSLAPPMEEEEKHEAFRQAFFNEARAAGKLAHRNIVAVHDAWVDEYLGYLVMEYVDGSTLKLHCSPLKLLPVQKTVNIIFQCAKALDYAHSHGVIHRDIKPSNILLTSNGIPKISDFGIAALAGVESPNIEYQLTGSVAYSSPEQLRREPLTPQSDIFSLGVVMFELLTGQRPFKADSDVALFYQMTQGRARPLRSVKADLPESLERILSKCLSPDLDQRFVSGAQLAQELIASFDHLKRLRAELNQEEKLNVLKKIAFFKEFTASELAEVIDATEWVKFNAASTIITEGEMDDYFYIIVSGEVVVRKRGKWLAKLKAGDCFGEMAYLGNIRRTASILARTDTILMKINVSVIDRTSLSTQFRFYKVFSTTLIERLARTSDLLSKEGSL